VLKLFESGASPDTIEVALATKTLLSRSPTGLLAVMMQHNISNGKVQHLTAPPNIPCSLPILASVVLSTLHGAAHTADTTAQVGSYHSTKVWAFTMRHHCGCKITIQTDPKNAEYLVTDGARRKIESYDADDAQTIEIPDANERAAVSADPLASLERKTIQVGELVRQSLVGKLQLVAAACDAGDQLLVVMACFAAAGAAVL
jgi:hypothetical protein